MTAAELIDALAAYPDDTEVWVSVGGLYGDYVFPAGTSKEVGGLARSVVAHDFVDPWGRAYEALLIEADEIAVA